MNADIFSIEDIETLIEALGDWENKHLESCFSVGVLGILLAPNDEPYEKQKQELTNSFNDAAGKTKMRKETSILLKAKLIQLKQAIAIKNLEKMAQKK